MSNNLIATYKIGEHLIIHNKYNDPDTRRLKRRMKQRRCGMKALIQTQIKNHQ